MENFGALICKYSKPFYLCIHSEQGPMHGAVPFRPISGSPHSKPHTESPTFGYIWEHHPIPFSPLEKPTGRSLKLPTNAMKLHHACPPSFAETRRRRRRLACSFSLSCSASAFPSCSPCKWRPCGAEPSLVSPRRTADANDCGGGPWGVTKKGRSVGGGG